MMRIELDFWDFFSMNPEWELPMYAKVVLKHEDDPKERYLYTRLEDNSGMFTTEFEDISANVKLRDIEEFYSIIHLNNFIVMDYFYLYDNIDEYDRDKALEVICD